MQNILKMRYTFKINKSVLIIHFQCSKLDHKLVESLKEKKQSDEVNQNLKRQIDSAKKEIQHFHIEAEKSIENPWETEEWEGLSACEVFDIIKHELVPAQQARYDYSN